MRRGRSAGSPGWYFPDQISEICPYFKLVCLENFIWPFSGLVSSWLASKIRLPFWLFWIFYAEKIFSVEIYLLFYVFGQHICESFVINAILSRRSLLVRFEEIRNKCFA